MVIPILMHIYSFPSNWNVASGIKLHKDVRHPTKCDVFNDVKLFPTVSQDIMSHILTLSNQTKASALEFVIMYATLLGPRQQVGELSCFRLVCLTVCLSVSSPSV